VGSRAGLDGWGKSCPPIGIRSPDRPTTFISFKAIKAFFCIRQSRHVQASAKCKIDSHENIDKLER